MAMKKKKDLNFNLRFSSVLKSWVVDQSPRYSFNQSMPAKKPEKICFCHWQMVQQQKQIARLWDQTTALHTHIIFIKYLSDSDDCSSSAHLYLAILPFSCKSQSKPQSSSSPSTQPWYVHTKGTPQKYKRTRCSMFIINQSREDLPVGEESHGPVH